VEQSTRIDVEAPVEQVWGVLRKVELWPEWAPTATWVRRLDNGPHAVGSRVRVEQPRIPPTAYVVTELEPSRSFTCARPQNGLERPGDYDVNGRPRLIFSPERLSPGGDERDFRDTRKALAQGGRRAARISRGHAEAAPGGGSSGCSCSESVAVHLRPHLSRVSVNLRHRAPLRTSADVRERDHDGLAVRGPVFESPHQTPLNFTQ
jgi:hypothetical protein